MKKLMIAALAVAFAAVAQAASVNWSNTGSRTNGTIYDYTGTAIGSGAVAYLFDVATISQADLLVAVRGGAKLENLTSVDHASTVSSKIATTPTIDYGTAGDSVTMYFAIVKDDQILIADEVNKTLQAADIASYQFGNSHIWSKETHGEASYTGAGWYSTVPEPTSALLLLLGMAGLALKRKQA